MNYRRMQDWNTVKAGLEKGLSQGVTAIRKSALTLKKKAGDLGEEGKRRYAAASLRLKMNRDVFELGKRVYALMGSGKQNPLLDTQVKEIARKLRKQETTIASLERTGANRGSRARKKAA